MKLHATKSEKSLNELARRLFKIEGTGSAAEKKAVEALKTANPQLRGGGALPKNAPVVVPDVKGLKASPEAAEGGVNLGDETAAEIKAAMELTAAALKTSFSEQDKAEKLMLKDLDRISSEGGTDSDIKKRVAAALEASGKRVELSKARRAIKQKALERLRDDSSELLDSIG
jgi:MoxR-like ATPase